MSTTTTPGAVHPEATCDVSGAAPGLTRGEVSIHLDMPEDVYHSDPVPGGSLSSSGARRLLDCPALFQHERLNGRPPRDTFDFGHAAHRIVLGAGNDLAVIDADDWRTKAAKDARDAARAEGLVPILAADHARAQAMAAAVCEHPIASLLIDHERGRPEVSLFWPDPRTDVMCRARIDWLPDPIDGRRLIATDYKTTNSAAPDALGKSAASYGYHQQAAWYLDGLRECDITTDAAFVFVAQEKTAPYLVTVYELDAHALRIGADLNARALALYAACASTDTWPGYSDDVVTVSLPGWAVRQHEETL